VTIGNVWQFGKLDRIQQTIFQDLNLFKVPDDLEDWVKVLVGILEGEEGERDRVSPRSLQDF
jgi:hypothetical protein